jgi:hypothetical protein
MPTYVRDAGAWKAVSGSSSTINDIGSANQVLYKNASNVATTSPNFTFNGSSVGVSGNITNGGFDFILGNTDQSSRGNSGASRALIKDNGAVLVLNYAGDFTGGTRIDSTLRVTGDVVAYASDIRLKTNIEPIQIALNKVLSINGFTYNFNEIGKELGFNTSVRNAGVSAQEVQAVLPEVVAPAPASDEYITVKYEKLVPLLIEAIKEQQETIANLQNRLEILEGK